MPTLSRLLALFATFALLGCSPTVDTSAAEAAVANFHLLLDQAKFNEIYEAAGEDFKKDGPRSEAIALFEAVHRKLGSARVVEKQTWSISYEANGTFIRLDYKTTFDKGEAKEHFVFRMQEGVASLSGFHVASNAFIRE